MMKFQTKRCPSCFRIPTHGTYCNEECASVGKIVVYGKEQLIKALETSKNMDLGLTEIVHRLTAYPYDARMLPLTENEARLVINHLPEGDLKNAFTRAQARKFPSFESLPERFKYVINGNSPAATASTTLAAIAGYKAGMKEFSPRTNGPTWGQLTDILTRNAKILRDMLMSTADVDTADFRLAVKAFQDSFKKCYPHCVPMVEGQYDRNTHTALQKYYPEVKEIEPQDGTVSFRGERTTVRCMSCGAMKDCRHSTIGPNSSRWGREFTKNTTYEKLAALPHNSLVFLNDTCDLLDSFENYGFSAFHKLTYVEVWQTKYNQWAKAKDSPTFIKITQDGIFGENTRAMLFRCVGYFDLIVPDCIKRFDTPFSYEQLHMSEEHKMVFKTTMQSTVNKYAKQDIANAFEQQGYPVHAKRLRE